MKEPPPAQYCFPEGGYWAWNGFEHVGVPSNTVSRYS
jgi:hypothetical protein